MMRKVIVPAPISRAIGELRLPRTLLLALLSKIHAEIPTLTDLERAHRHPDDERLFMVPLRLFDEGRTHIFLLTIDDSTSADAFLLAGIGHLVQGDVG